MASPWQLWELFFPAPSMFPFSIRKVKPQKTRVSWWAVALHASGVAAVRACEKMKRETLDGMKTRTGKAGSVSDSSWGVAKLRGTAGRTSKEKQPEKLRELSREKGAARGTPGHQDEGGGSVPSYVLPCCPAHHSPYALSQPTLSLWYQRAYLVSFSCMIIVKD